MLARAGRQGETILNSASFWSVATLLVLASTALIVVPLFWLTRRAAPDDRARLRKLWPAAAIAMVVPLAALTIYSLVVKPQAPTAPGAATGDIAALHARSAMQGGQSAGDLGEAIDRLRARLAANPADANGWRLLAQSYQYLGRTAEAEEANRMAEAAASGTAIKPESDAFVPEAFAAVSGGEAPPAAPAPARSASTDQQVQRAQEHRRRREFHQANEIFAQLARAGRMDADLWADYSDSLGGENGALNEKAAECIDAALRLDPGHAKALWLLGSWQTQRGDYASALSTWQKLAQIFPAGSSDARIIAANIDEARARLGVSGTTKAKASHAVAVSGSVQLDSRWLARVPAGTTLFVFARAADEHGPPLAVWRTTAGAWPLSFSLSDANAMLPDRKLSDYSRVIVEARVSRSGNPIAQPGDLQAVSPVLDPHSAREIRLTIDKEVAPIAAQGG